MFDRYLDAEPARAKARARRTVVFFGSFVLHVLAGIGLVIYSFIHVEEVEPPPLTVSFFSAPPPPPPPPPPPGGGQKKTEKKKVIPKQALVQPTDVKPLEQPKTTDSDEISKIELTRAGGKKAAGGDGEAKPGRRHHRRSK